MVSLLNSSSGPLNKEVSKENLLFIDSEIFIYIDLIFSDNVLFLFLCLLTFESTVKVFFMTYSCGSDGQRKERKGTVPTLFSEDIHFKSFKFLIELVWDILIL